ncbi:MAG TPA: hypothetical protein VLM17_01350 [Xanthomonadaceae bacterium]|nr:hypothetical protein [Xanthomonadaceae bacterium]
MGRRPRRHRRIALMVLLCLFFQQAALAAYACPIERMPARMDAMAAHCAEMGMRQAQDNPALCAKHCAPDRSTAADQAKLSVPALLLPPPGFATVALVPAAAGGGQADVRLARSDPPPRLRFCTLLL